MKNLLCIVAVMLLISACHLSSSQESQSLGQNSLSPEQKALSPLEVVNLRMQAFNEHNLDEFLKTYSEEIEVFTYPAKRLGKGKKHMERLFRDVFEEGSVYVDMRHQIAKDSYVINHETVTSGGEKTEYISIYEVRDGLIKSVRFVRD